MEGLIRDGIKRMIPCKKGRQGGSLLPFLACTSWVQLWREQHRELCHKCGPGHQGEDE